jgi:hypothetical protein
MLVRASKLRLRFQAYCENWNQQIKDDDDSTYNVSEDKLSPEEWDGVQEIIRVLSPFKKLTKRIERRDKSLQDIVPYYDKVLGHLYDCCQQFKRKGKVGHQKEVYQWLYLCAEAAWDKANELYKKVDDSPAYYTARVVDPCSKFEWFEQRWGPDRDKSKWLEGMKKVVNDHWRTYQGRYLPQGSNARTQQAQPPTLSDDVDDGGIDDSFGLEEYMRISHNSQLTREVDAFVKYTSSAPERQFQLAQWQLIEQTHPDLVQFALDHAAVPISISDCERSFSSAKFALNPLRTRMKSDLFEALETLRAWYLEDEAQKQKTENRQMEQEEQQIIAEAVED